MPPTTTFFLEWHAGVVVTTRGKSWSSRESQESDGEKFLSLIAGVNLD
jgi:hypothetical protein